MMPLERQVTFLALSQRLAKLGAVPTGSDQEYWVSKKGAVYSLKYKRIQELKFSVHNGYRRVMLSYNNKRYVYPVHRLVAGAFIGNPGNKPYVNHKDGNRSNNFVSNLEWCTAKENQKHSREVLGNTGRGTDNGNYGHRKSKFYPSQELRNRLIALGVPRNRHDIVSLGEMLTDHIDVGLQYDLSCWKEDDGWRIRYGRIGSMYHEIEASSEAEARGLMLEYLITNGLLKD